MTIGQRILKYRKDNNLSQEEVAEKLEVTRQTVSKWETDQSTPDFDKIAPLCKLFNISADELITGEKLETKSTGEIKENLKGSKALVLSSSVFLYFVAVTWIIFASEFLNINDGIMVSIFMLICGLATCLIIYYFVRHGNDVKNVSKLKEEEQTPVKKAIKNILALLTTCIYLLISFSTGAWAITWIIWLIYAALESLIDLIYELKGDNNAR